MKPRFALWLGAALFSSVVSCEAKSRNDVLSYQGWRVGLSRDSANRLTLRDIGDTLKCVREPVETFCAAGDDEDNANARLLMQMSTDSNRVTAVFVLRSVPPGISTDTLRAGLIEVWGPPDSVSRSEPFTSGGTVIPLGHWNSTREHVYASEATLPDSSRWLTVSLVDRVLMARKLEVRGAIPLTPDRFKPNAR
jgi:hypothetical protein